MYMKIPDIHINRYISSRYFLIVQFLSVTIKPHRTKRDAHCARLLQLKNSMAPTVLNLLYKKLKIKSVQNYRGY